MEVWGVLGGGFTDEIGATAFADRLVAVKTRYKEVETISTLVFEDFTACSRGSCWGEEGFGHSGEASKFMGLSICYPK